MDNTRKYIVEMETSAEFGSIADAQAALQALAAAAHDAGLSVTRGVAAVAREREPVEQFVLGSDAVYTNMTAREGTPEHERWMQRTAA